MNQNPRRKHSAKTLRLIAPKVESDMVFEDRSGARWRWLRIPLYGGLLFTVVLLGLLGASTCFKPPLPSVEDVMLVDELGAVEMRPELPPLPVNLNAHAAASNPTAVPKRNTFPKSKLLRTAFVSQSSQASVMDLRKHVHDLDAVFPDWFGYTGAAEGLQTNIDPDVRRCLDASKALVLPLISNADEKAVWHGKDVGKMLADAERSQSLIVALADECVKARVAGVNIDFEALAEADRDAYTAWLKLLAAEFHARGLLVTIDVPPADPAFDYAAIGSIMDAVVVMAYDEHDSASDHGAVSSLAWFNETIARLSKVIPPERMIVGIGTYCYDWDTDTDTAQPARTISFTEAMHLADELETEVELDRETLNGHFGYKEPDGDEHEVWMLDAIAVWNEFNALQGQGFRGLALWRLGLEEPGIWDFIGLEDLSKFDPARLATIQCGDAVVVAGDGEVIHFRDANTDGQRKLTLNGRTVEAAIYTQFPKYVHIDRHGHADELQVALTFDDGPDPQWTPQILDILRDNGVPATFFVLGSRAVMNPDLLHREYDEGHVIGSHSFSHPHLRELSAAGLNRELDSTQRVIEAITGHQTRLFRCPYDTDSVPLSPEQFGPMHRVSDRGYLLAGADVDSADWTIPGTQRMIDAVLAGLKDTGSNIVVMHDYGADRHQTVEAVRALIPLLKNMNYKFVTVADLLKSSRGVLMPPVPVSERPFIYATSFLAWTMANLYPVVIYLVYFVTAFAFVRALFLLVMIAQSAWRRKPLPPLFAGRKWAPPVTVLIPAYNESKVIARTIDAVLKCDYHNLTVLVVNDGSTDDTAAIVASLASNDLRIRLLTKPNGGKFSALNLGFAEASTEHIVTIDGDTIILPDTIRHLLNPFADSRVDAVCGNVQVGNVNSLITRFQDVEYVTTQNYDRRAFEALNCITVVPGATGAWKRSTILDIGGYSNETLTEDADITLSLLRRGGKIVYAPNARSVTEAPENASGLYKQRFRWNYGCLQCMWKHKHAFGRGKLGLLGLPNMLYPIVFQILGPVCDILLLLYLFSGEFAGVATFYGIFLALDMAIALVAYALDKRKVTSLWVVPLHRFVYRPLLYTITIFATLAAFRGRRHGWNKLERQGTVRPAPEPLLLKIRQP